MSLLSGISPLGPRKYTKALSADAANVAVLTLWTALLGAAFLALLVSDQVQAAVF